MSSSVLRPPSSPRLPSSRANSAPKAAELLRFKIDNFATLSSEPDDESLSETVTCSNGMGWKLRIYPGGITDSPGTEGSPDTEDSAEGRKIGVFFTKWGDGEVHASYTLIIRNASGDVYHQKNIGEYHYVEHGGGWGKRKFIKRADLVDVVNNILVGGALLVDVELRIRPEQNQCYVPKNPHEKNMLALFENQDNQLADIALKVEGEKMFAHKNILAANAPVLFGLCGRHNKRSPVPVSGIARDVLELLLRYIYAGSVPGEDIMKERGKEIIDAANRYGVVGLKMAAESAVVRSMTINCSNLVDWLLFADAKTCPLIKEYGMALLAVRPKDFLSDHRLNTAPVLKQELMMASFNSFDSDTRFGDSAHAMTVSELRKRLDEEELDADGSKEMLIGRLEESNKRQRTE